MTISQLLGSIRYHEAESVAPDTRHRVLTIVRRCLIWTAITLAASWIISSHVFAEEMVTASGLGAVTVETLVSPMSEVTPIPETTLMQATGCTGAPYGDVV